MPAQKLSRFFERIQIGTHVGISPNSLRVRLQKMEKLLPEFQAICEASAVLETNKTRHIVAAADETFLGEILMLVMMDLSSGYLLLEDIADDRRFETWLKAAKPRLSGTHIEIDHLITDRAKALIKLATQGFECESGADLFQSEQILSRQLGNPLKRRYSQTGPEIQKAWKSLSDLFKRDSDSPLIGQIADKIISLNQEKAWLKRDNKIYDTCLKSISMAVHAFDIDSHKQQTSVDVEDKLETLADTLEGIEKHHFPGQKVVASIRKQKKALASCIDVWWHFVIQSLLSSGLSSNEQDWIMNYWHANSVLA